MILVRPEHRDDLLSAAGLIVLDLACASKLEAYRKALEEIKGGSFPGASDLAISVLWQQFVERLQDIARKALAAGE